MKHSTQYSINLQSLLSQKYTSLEYDYTYISTHNLIFNERCLIVSHFKDFLIYDDLTEFLRRYYTLKEIHPRLSRILLFFETYSKIYPNYMILPEANHLFRNIRKKQKMIDAINAIKKEEEENRQSLARTKKNVIESYQSNCNVVFTPKINKSILKYEPSKTITESSISTSLWARKVNQELDNSFVYTRNQSDDQKQCNSNSIEELIQTLNTKFVKNITDYQIKKQAALNLPLSTQQTPKQFQTKRRYFLNRDDIFFERSQVAIPISNKTAVKIKNTQFLNSPLLHKNCLSNINNVFKFKPVNNLNIITNNFQNIVIPQSTSKSNTVITNYKNCFSCSDISTKTRGDSIIKSASLFIIKKQNTNDHIIKKNNFPFSKSKLVNPESITKSTDRNNKQEATLLLSSLNLLDCQNTIQKNQTSRTKSVPSNIQTKRVNKLSNSNNKTNHNTNDNVTKIKNNNNCCSQESYHSNQLRSSLRERELNKERKITQEIKHRFKMFIERSKMRPLTNRRSYDSISPKRSIRNKSVNNINNLIQNHSFYNNCQKNITSSQAQINTQERMFSLGQSLNDNNNPITPLIKVNLKPSFQKSFK